MTQQQVSDRGLKFICRHEGFRSDYYLDPVGVGTIGHGFTWGSGQFKKWWQKHKPGTRFRAGVSMSRDEAEACMAEIIELEYAEAVRQFYGNDPIKQCVFDASVSMVYNCGPRALKWKWAAYAREGKHLSAGMRLEKTATTAKGVKLKGLVNRRRDESLLLQRGDYGDDLPPSRHGASRHGATTKAEETPSPGVMQSLRKKLIGLFDKG